MSISDTKMVHIRIPVLLWERILKASHKKGQNASSEIRRVLYDEFGEPERKESDSIEGV